jgi:hypothetical protein
MDFNFYEQYKHSSTVELLLIVKQPGKYQPAAVDAAKMLLRERNVDEQEEEEVAHIVHTETKQQDEKLKRQQAQKEKAKGTVISFIEPILNPRKEFPAQKWINILLTIVALRFIWRLYQNVRMWIIIAQCEDCVFDGLMLFTAIELLYLPAMFLLLWKRKALGWELSFGLCIYMLGERLAQLYFIFSNFDVFGKDLPGAIISIVGWGAFAFLFWMNHIAAIFTVSINGKRQTTKVAIYIVAIYWLVLTLMASDVKIIG